MAAAKTLEQHVRDRTFRSRRHHDLLAGSILPWPELAALQLRYRAASHELERRAIGVQFERALQDFEVDRVVGEAYAELEAILHAPPEPWREEYDRELST